jgi:hypothetical protein
VLTFVLFVVKKLNCPIINPLHLLTNQEKRFIRYWEDQRKGGKLKYYLLYIIAGTFIASVVLSFLSVMFRVGFPEKIWLIVTASFLIISISTILTWSANEKKFKTIIRREIDEGKFKDERFL